MDAARRTLVASVFAALVAAMAAPAGAGPIPEAATVLRPDPKGPSPVIACDLPPTAVKAVPAPFDRYMELGCTTSGQALKPLNGYQFVFAEGPIWMIAADPKAPSPQAHYTELAVVPMTPKGVSAMRAELHRVTSEPTVFLRDIIRMDVTTSTGLHKQVFLLTPPKEAPAGARVLGMECGHYCIPIDKDPWFFTVVPDAPAS